MAWFGRRRAEDPERLKRFLDVIASADWQNQPREAIRALFGALNDLAYHEILFYYRARKKQRRLSQLTRALMVLFGTVGVLVPLLAAADADHFKGWAAYGYPLIAVAAACHVVNRLFGATGGHIRYVTAQLELEKLLTMFRIDCSAWYARNRSDISNSDAIETIFPIFRTFAEAIYKVLQEETNVWGKSVSEALQEYADKLEATKKPAITPTTDAIPKSQT